MLEKNHILGQNLKAFVNEMYIYTDRTLCMQNAWHKKEKHLEIPWGNQFVLNWRSHNHLRCSALISWMRGWEMNLPNTHFSVYLPLTNENFYNIFISINKTSIINWVWAYIFNLLISCLPFLLFQHECWNIRLL